MKEILREHALSAYQTIEPYFKKILEGFPEEKFHEKIGTALTPFELLQHVVGTPGWWMKQRGTRFPFSSSIKTVDQFFEVLRKQEEYFANALEDEKELYWKSKDEEKPRLSIPWIMIRSFNHALHHGAMLIHYRHLYSLPPIQFEKGMHWGNIVDIPGNLWYGKMD
ncbi:MAG: hypothetical protein D6732_29145 [Methanobacteriota archaeon]|nr:MAG: hypothetical protein D6732_29145 [Euryarchaeota archaeon]